MNTINIIIPTMWKEQKLVEYISSYVENPFIQKIIIIDNNHIERPKSDIFKHEKIELVSYRRNIYVNPAWNFGVRDSKYDLVCIMNDDIIFNIDVFDFIESNLQRDARARLQNGKRIT